MVRAYHIMVRYRDLYIHTYVYIEYQGLGDTPIAEASILIHINKNFLVIHMGVYGIKFRIFLCRDYLVQLTVCSMVLTDVEGLLTSSLNISKTKCWYLIGLLHFPRGRGARFIPYLCGTCSKGRGTVLP